MMADGHRPDFAQEILAEPGGEHLYRCYSCGTCTATCLIRRVDPDFNPRRMLSMAVMNERERVLSSREIWLCSACDLCYQRCPQEIHLSELMGAIRHIAIREGYGPPGPFAQVDEALCSGCGMCATACPYEGIELVTRSVSGNGHNPHKVAQVDELSCMACGICAATCPSGAIRVDAFSRDKVAARMQAGGWFAAPTVEPKIMAFICNWCLHVEDDLIALDAFPPNVRVVNVPCTGQLDPSLVLTALAEGADGVMVIGCEPGQCHYQSGNLLARQKVWEMRRLLTALGIEEERLRLMWIATTERGKVIRRVEAFAEGIEALGKSPLRREDGRP